MNKMQNKEAERDFFDNSCNISPWITFNKNGQDAIFDTFKKIIRPLKEELTIDMGCGTGEFSNELQKLGLKVIGIDISEKSIEMCKKKFGEKIKFEVKDIEHTKYDDNSVDIIFFGGILHHFPERQAVFKEAYRILKRDGRIFAFDPNYYNLIIWTYREVLGIKTQKTENEILIKKKIMREDLQAAGFDDIDVKSIANVTFSIEYFKKLVPFPIYYSVYVYNMVEKCLNLIKPIREKYGSFVITYAKK